MLGVVLLIEPWLWATWDTSFTLHNDGPGKPPIMPVPTVP
jgi:hypothetical protein